MRTAVDTNVLSAILSGESPASKCKTDLFEAQRRGELVICALVYAELCAYPRATQDLIDRFLHDTRIGIDFHMGEHIWRETAQRFASYALRKRKSGGGNPKRVLVDFIVGAHALLNADRFLTLDEDRYLKDFPELHLI